MIHQPLGGAEGQASDIEIQAKEVLRIREQINGILSKHTGQTLKKIEKDTDRDFFFNSKQALEYGLIDQVIENRGPKKEDEGKEIKETKDK
jgi:ATP-dependent Clp protease protease subunit